MSSVEAKNLHISFLEEELEKLIVLMRKERIASKSRLKELESKFTSEIREAKIELDSKTKNFRSMLESYEKTIRELKLKYNLVLLEKLEKRLSYNWITKYFNNNKQYLTKARKFAKSSLFDGEWYENQYSLDPKKDNAILHYIINEDSLKYNPSKYFDIKEYVERYADVKDSKLSPLAHYIDYGKNENRKIYKV